MRKLLLAALVCLPATVLAQEQAEQPPHGTEGPHIEEPAQPVDTGHGAAGHGDGAGHGAGHGNAHADPTKHFNWLGSPFEHYGKDIYGGKYGDGQMTDPHTGQVVLDAHGNPSEEPMSAPFVWMLLNFGLLLLILAKWGAPAARKLAEERHEQIKAALDEAARLRDEAAQKLAEYEAKVKGVDAEVKKLVDDIRATAEGDKQRILEAAAAQAAQMKREAEQRIAAEIEYARRALQREVTLAATNAAEKQLKEKLTSDDQNKLVGTFITSVQGGSRKEAR